MNKLFLFIVGTPALLVLVILVAGVYRFNSTTADTNVESGNGEYVAYDEQNGSVTGGDERRVANPETPTAPVGKLKADMFSGKLEEVNTGCFADGECYVVVDGKHVTALRGWSQDVVGTVIGVEGFGDLEGAIGKVVEVYAQDLGSGTYTLYGSEGFYIKIGNGKITPSPQKPVAGGGCVVGGCSNQLCVDASEGDVVSTCEYREEYACYQTASCERQASGQCGWTDTAELQQCRTQAQGSGILDLQVQ